MPAGLEWLSASARRANSNNWVLANRRTKAGRPILANDPHLQIEFPSVWYEMHLVAADLDVVGVTIPGVPVVALGHNARIAWGMTNTGADVQDLALERIDVRGKRSFYRGEWVPIDDRQGRHSRCAAAASRCRSRCGRRATVPIVAEVGLNWDAPPSWLSPDDRPAEEQRAYSLRWDVSGDLATAFDAINRATDWASFTAAVNGFSAPSQNIVYADVDGNIGYAMSGRLPVRSGGDGRMPVDGSAGTAWTGSIDPSTLPRVLNPDAGFIASANNLVDRSYQPLITNDWAAPFRATRLRDQLSKAEGVDLDAMAALQNDRRSAAADVLLAGLDSAIKKGRAIENERRWAERLEELAKWDRVVDSRPIVSFYQAFEDAVWRRTFIDEMEEELFFKFYEWAGGEKPAGIYALLDDPQSKWWDDILTVEITRNPRRDFPDRGAGRRAVSPERVGRRVEPRLGSHPRGQLRAPARQRDVCVPLALQSRPGAGRGRRQHRDADQLEPPGAIQGLGIPVVAAAVRRGRVGRVTRDPGRRPVRPPDEPVLLQPKRALAAGPIPPATLFQGSGCGRSETPAAVNSLAVASALDEAPADG